MLLAPAVVLLIEVIQPSSVTVTEAQVLAALPAGLVECAPARGDLQIRFKFNRRGVITNLRTIPADAKAVRCIRSRVAGVVLQTSDEVTVAARLTRPEPPEVPMNGGEAVGIGTIAPPPSADSIRAIGSTVTLDITRVTPPRHKARVVNELSARTDDFRACYGGALASEPDLAGTFEYTAHVNAKGAVTKVTARTATRLDACVRNVTKKVRFAARAASTVTFSLTVSPR